VATCEGGGHPFARLAPGSRGVVNGQNVRRHTATRIKRVELTRFRGRLLSLGEKGVHLGQLTFLSTGVPGAADPARAGRADAGGAGAGVRALRPDDRQSVGRHTAVVRSKDLQ